MEHDINDLLKLGLRWNLHLIMLVAGALFYCWDLILVDLIFDFFLYFVQCKFCDKQGNITVVPGRDKPYTFEDSESGKFVPIGCFDCRGIETVEFSFRDGWAAEGVNTIDYFEWSVVF